MRVACDFRHSPEVDREADLGFRACFGETTELVVEQQIALCPSQKTVDSVVVLRGNYFRNKPGNGSLALFTPRMRLRTLLQDAIQGRLLVVGRPEARHCWRG